jgi:hypothetical protein
MAVDRVEGCTGTLLTTDTRAAVAKIEKANSGVGMVVSQ